MLVKSGPGLKTNSALFGSHTETPSTSEGSMSEVNWMRWKEAPMDRASAEASVVLPTPGTSSISRCPRATRPMMASRTTSGLPNSARPTFSSRRRMVSVESPIGFHYTVRAFFDPAGPLAGAGPVGYTERRDGPRSAPPAPLGPRRPRGVRLHLRSRRGDAVDGARRARAGDPVAGALRPGGRAAAHPGAPARPRDPRLVLHPRVDRRALPGRGPGDRGGRPADRVPRRRAPAGERAAPRPRGGHPAQERRGAHAARGQAAGGLSRARVAALRRDARAARAARLRLLVEHDGSPRAVPSSGRRRPSPRGDPGLVGARRRAVLHVHRAAVDPAAGAGAARVAHRVRGHHGDARGDQLHLPPADHRPALAPGLPPRADGPRAPPPAGVDRHARPDQRALPRRGGGRRGPAGLGAEGGRDRAHEPTEGGGPMGGHAEGLGA